MDEEVRQIVTQINLQCNDVTYPNDYNKTINELTWDLFLLIEDYCLMIPTEE